jgi:transcriptional regulator with XRE-family HTH domain
MGELSPAEVLLGREIGERLREIRGRQSRADVQECTGIHPNTLAKYEGGRMPDSAFVIRFCEAYGINEAWLLTGREPRNRADARTVMERALGVGEFVPPFDGPVQAPEGFVLVPVFNIQASSGHGAFPAPSEEEREPLAFPTALLKRLASSGFDRLSIVFNRGESNEPDIYVFAHGDALMVKLIERFVDGRVALKARNPGYREEILSEEDAARLTIFGRVVWRGGLV